MDIFIWEASVMPAAVVFEGEHAGSAGRVPTVGVDDCTESSEEQRLISSLGCFDDNPNKWCISFRTHRTTCPSSQEHTVQIMSAELTGLTNTIGPHRWAESGLFVVNGNTKGKMSFECLFMPV